MITDLNEELFKNKIFNYSPLEDKTLSKEERKNAKWKFIGDNPTIIDFYADWCGPCKMIGPILEELSEEYKGKIDIYKINTEEETYLASMFDIRSIPSMLFIPINGDNPKMHTGALPKNELKKLIDKELL